MECVRIVQQFVLIKNDLGEYMIGRQGGEFKHIIIPVGWGSTATLSLDNIVDMTYQVYPDTDSISFPVAQLCAALHDAFPWGDEHDRWDKNAFESVKDVVFDEFEDEIYSLEEEARKEVRDIELERFPELLDDAEDVSTHEFGDPLTLDYAVDFIYVKTNCFSLGEIQEILLRDYSSRFDEECNDGEEEQ